MPELSFQVEGAEAVPFAAQPLIGFRLRIVNANAQELIHTIVLRCQIRIETTRRHYSEHEQQRLLDLFDKPERWSQTLHSMFWTHVSTIVPPFTGSTTVDVQVPCSFDFNVAATKYFAGLESGEIPLNLLLSGSVFYEAEGGALQVAQIPWDKEASYRLPVQVWKQMMDIYYPNSAWLCLRRDVFDRLYQYKLCRGLATWEQTLDSLLASADKP
jgi:hypothetical protein